MGLLDKASDTSTKTPEATKKPKAVAVAKAKPAKAVAVAKVKPAKAVAVEKLKPAKAVQAANTP